jgi:hypothetical protein
MKTWSLTVEEDPETGDAILTFPPDESPHLGSPCRTTRAGIEW